MTEKGHPDHKVIKLQTVSPSFRLRTRIENGVTAKEV